MFSTAHTNSRIGHIFQGWPCTHIGVKICAGLTCVRVHPFEDRGLPSTLEEAQCGRSAGCVLCALRAVSVAVLGGEGGERGTLWG